MKQRYLLVTLGLTVVSGCSPGSGSGSPSDTSAGDASGTLDGGSSSPSGDGGSAEDSGSSSADGGSSSSGGSSGTAATSVSVGYDSACAVSRGGSVQCWGINEHGNTPDAGDAGFSSTPAPVPGLPSGASGVSVASGFDFCAIVGGGAVECWVGGRLAQVPGLTSGATAVSVGLDSTCAVTAGGAVQCWGNNDEGQLGNDSDAGFSSVPVQVTGLTSGVTSVAVGAQYACAVTGGGAVECWGYNDFGQLGNNSDAGFSSVPVQVTGLTSGVTSISVGYASVHACAITAGGGVQCWGNNDDGQLGNGTTAPQNPAPVQVTGLTGGVTAVGVGASSTCAVTAGGAVQCWGSNNGGQLGSDGGGSSVPLPVTGLTSDAISVSVGFESACAVMGSGGIQCWGDNTYGELGNGSTTQSSVPVQVTGF